MDGARRHATAMMQCLFKCLAVKSRRNLEGVDGGSGRSALGATEHSEQQGGDGDQRRLAGAASGRDQGQGCSTFFFFWTQHTVLQAGVCSSNSCASANRLKKQNKKKRWAGIAAYLCSDG